MAARHVIAGLELGEKVVALVTPAHENLLRETLRRHGIDVGHLCREGGMTFLDAGTVLEEFMVDGLPDPGLFFETLVPVLELATAHRTRPVRAYGEMVDLLWGRGLADAALRLEELWNALGEAYAITLLCAYASSRFAQGGDGLAAVCARHGGVEPADSPRSAA